MSNTSYLSNPRLKKAGVTFKFSKHQIAEIEKCAADPIYFAENYYKIVHVDHGLVPFAPYDYQRRLIRSFFDDRFVITKMPRQSGKALALDTPIPTPSGWTTMGDITVGDTIFGADGKPTTVTFATEVMRDRPCFVVQFDTGDEIVADHEHLWEVNHPDWRTGAKVVTTAELIDIVNTKKKNVRTGMPYIRISRPIECAPVDLPIDPYVLGLWLGDGHSEGGRIICSNEDYGVYEPLLLASGHRLIENKIALETCRLFRIEGLTTQLRLLGVRNNKHIPAVYLRASVDQRLALLRGLMDTDGSIDSKGSCEFYQKSKPLILQVRELLSSLGIKSRLRAKTIKDEVYHTLSFTTSLSVFELPRKKERQRTFKHPKNERFYVHDIVPTESVPVRCIQVDNSDKLFLCTETMIPTHNSTACGAYLLWFILFAEHKSVLMLANKETTAKELLKRVKLAYEHIPLWMQQGVQKWDQTKIELENGSSILASATTGSAARGTSASLVYLDEFAFVPTNIADEFFASVYPTISSGKTTKIIIVSCVGKDTMVLTPDGPRRVSSFIDETQPICPIIGYEVDPYRVVGMTGPNTGRIMVNSGQAETRTITTTSSTLTCSLEHKLWVCRNGVYEWCRAGDLSENDFISIRYGLNVWGNQDSLSDIQFDQGRLWANPNEFSPPDHVTDDLAYFFGLLLAEGYIADKDRYGSVTITCGDDVSDAIQKLGLRFSCTDGIHYTISSRSLVNFLVSFGFDPTKKAKEKTIPDRLMKCSGRVIRHFLSGYFDGDGCATNKGTISVVSASEQMIDQIRTLLMNIGILSQKTQSVIPPSEKVAVESTVFTLHIQTVAMCHRFHDEIGFRFQRKADRRSLIRVPKRKTTKDVIPFGRKLLREANITRNEPAAYRRSEHLSREVALEERLPISTDILSPTLKWEHVSRIETGTHEVYDFSLDHVDGDPWCHSVLYNGIVGHQTPNGMNHYWEMWEKAVQKKSSFVPVEIHWSEHPDRDEAWAAQQRANMTPQQFAQEFECQFVGGLNTLIDPTFLSTIEFIDPIQKINDLAVYERPKPGHRYVLCLDTAEGVGQDYSAFVVVDVTQIPYRLVAKYQSKYVSPVFLPLNVVNTAKSYNEAYIMIETATVGYQVGYAIWFEHEYPNVFSVVKVKGTTKLKTGFSQGYVGVKMTPRVRNTGCANLKTLIESRKLIFNDADVVKELSNFVFTGNKFEADDGHHDDLVMSLVLFAWLAKQGTFTSMTETEIGITNDIDQDRFIPFIVTQDYLDPNVEHADGMVWNKIGVGGPLWYGDGS